MGTVICAHSLFSDKRTDYTSVLTLLLSSDRFHGELSTTIHRVEKPRFSTFTLSCDIGDILNGVV